MYVASFEVRHPRCVSNKSNCKVYAYIVKHNYVFGGMLFTIRKVQGSRRVWLGRTGIVMLRRGDIGDSLRGL